MRVAGIDSSTQSTKVVVVDDGVVIRSGRASHPDGTEVDPQLWWEALKAAIADAGGIADCEAVSVAGQQHGLLCLDTQGEVLRPALLWNDLRSASSAADLIDEDSVEFWVNACGSAPVASLTVSKVRWVADNEPEVADRIAAICLPHDWLTWKLSGSTDIRDLVTDRSDASGTGYVDCRTGQYRFDLLARALRRSEDEAKAIVLPRIAEPFETVGSLSAEFGSAKLGPGCGDNAAAALGLGLRPGQASVSLGTSGVVACVSNEPVIDDAGEVTGFMDATGNWLPLACTINGSRIVDYVKNILSVSYAEFDELAASASPSGLVLIPYFEGERTPNLPSAQAAIVGLTPATATPAAFARGAVEGMCCLLRGAMEALIRGGARIDSAVLIGGGAKSQIVQQMMANILHIPVEVPQPAEYVALGAAWQAMRLRVPDLQPWAPNMTRFDPQGDDGAWKRYQDAISLRAHRGS
ncbi:xylulokinase [Trueperella pyogenes TP8]|uniref:xylulokinase n=1 Tax=Trueperella pyogenes TaxID=1661 RepID=UPI00057DADFA|nr:FGGY family carbohydrate kinase [Trueperella pyogenes]AJC70115.1 xylulokinase [Trueperella pyogenes TP8]